MEPDGRVADPNPRKGRNFNLRAYLGGGTATVALIAGAVIVFGGLAAYVGFNGLPVIGDGATDASVVVQARSDAPEAIAATVVAPPAAVAPTAAAPNATPAAGAAAGTGGIDGAGDDPPSSGAPTTDGTTNPTSPSTPTAPAGSPSGAGDAGGGSSSGPLGAAGDGVEDVGSGLGVDLPLGDATEAVEGAISETANGIGGALDNSNLGDQVGGELGGLTG